VVFRVVDLKTRGIVDHRSGPRDGADGAIKEVGYGSVDPA
jgi:hypothetical protein